MTFTRRQSPGAGTIMAVRGKAAGTGCTVDRQPRRTGFCAYSTKVIVAVSTCSVNTCQSQFLSSRIVADGTGTALAITRLPQGRNINSLSGLCWFIRHHRITPKVRNNCLR